MTTSNTEEFEKEISARRNKRKGLINLIEIGSLFIMSLILFSSGYLDEILYAIFKQGYVRIGELPSTAKAIFVTFFAISYTVIYGISPIQKITLIILGNKVEGDSSIFNIVEILNDLKLTQEQTETEDKIKARDESLDYYLKKLIDSSESLAKNIYSRGSLYLMTGVGFAIIGLGFFYSQTHFSARINEGGLTQLVSILPNFGVLFFLELIAFFFLKQYRTTMDEFRYYEAIKRSREETLAVIKLITLSKKELDILEVLDKLNFSSQVGKLDSGQTTEIIESRKLEKGELEALMKIVELVTNKLGQSGK
ncbi:hypothetical protein [Enterobacter roggenkampii]|uniref:hypothetical protein n=1 Tax=Enterobacter roggenkampii TaxID=1812935 RepID=UPI002DBB3C1D|nr:hypothetical protein [Enterobacter roggenkampii]MEB6619580.1 hypothetical protein [Enterobacter roggenkampii]